MCLLLTGPQRHHLCQYCCHVPTHLWPAMSAARLLPHLHSPLTALVCCHVPTPHWPATPSPLSVLLPCAYSSLACNVCRQVAASSTLTSDSPRLLSCAYSSLACNVTAARFAAICSTRCAYPAALVPSAIGPRHVSPVPHQTELIKPVTIGYLFFY